MSLRSETRPGLRSLALRRRVAGLALPAVGEQLLNTLVGLVDVFLLGHLSATAAAQLGYTSAAALAGAGLANMLVWLVLVFFSAVGVGATALVARARGANTMGEAGDVLRQSLLLALVLGLLATAVVLPLAEWAVAGLGASPDVLPLGVSYLTITALSFGPAAILLVGTAALRGAGDTRTPLYVMALVNAVNIVVSWLLISGNAGAPVWGVAGAATGAALARTAGGLVLVALLVRGRAGMRLVPSLRPDMPLLRRIIAIGAPSGGEQLVFQGALLIFISFVTALGTASYAAHNLVINIESVSFLPGMGYALAASALVGQGLGARRPDEAQQGALEALRQGLLLMCALGIVMVLFPQQLLSLMVSDPAVIAAGTTPMRIAGLLQPLMGVSLIVSGSLRGAGDTRWPLYIKIISTWCVRLPLVLLFGWLGFGLTGIWMAMGTDFFVQALLALRRFRSGRWKTISV
jgi:putative MATE family efflux protein